jgi:hypothetical protein
VFVLARESQGEGKIYEAKKRENCVFITTIFRPPHVDDGESACNFYSFFHELGAVGSLLIKESTRREKIDLQMRYVFAP